MERDRLGYINAAINAVNVILSSDDWRRSHRGEDIQCLDLIREVASLFEQWCDCGFQEKQHGEEDSTSNQDDE